MRYFLIFIIGAIAVSLCLNVEGVLAGGFNANRIKYLELPVALQEAKIQQKPIYLMIHKSWCAACKALRKKVEKSAEIEALAEHFIMADAEDDAEPAGEEYAPQGSYSPRLLFLGSDGTVLPITNPAGTDPASPHFYGSAPEIVRGMVAALAHVGVHALDEI